MAVDGQYCTQTRSVGTLRELRYSRSLERGLAILACFAPEQPLMGIAELAGSLQLSRATTHRYVTTLVALGLLEQDQSRKYRLRLGVIDLGMAALNEIGLPGHARPYLAGLAERTGHTVDLAVLDGVESLLVERACPPGRGRADQAKRCVGSRNPAHRTSAGKVLLAYLPPPQRSRLISRMEPAGAGPKSIIDNRALDEELERVRERGLAMADEEPPTQACGIATPIRTDSADVVAAVSVVAHTWEIAADELAERFEGVLITTAEEISACLGWSGW